MARYPMLQVAQDDAMYLQPNITLASKGASVSTMLAVLLLILAVSCNLPTVRGIVGVWSSVLMTYAIIELR